MTIDAVFLLRAIGGSLSRGCGREEMATVVNGKIGFETKVIQQS